MPNFPPNYKEQESYYSSQEYKDTATMALEQGNKLPTFEDKKAGKSYTPRRLHQKLPPLSYPLKSGPNQRTGDRLVIKCLKFEPPEAGAGATVTPTNLFKKDKDTGKVSVYTTADRAKIKENIKNNKPGGYGSYTGDEKPGIEFSVTDANSRMSKDANRLMKYLIELPIPQDLSDSNSVTWGEDRANALELAALAVAQEAMQGNIGENAVNLAQTAVTALNTGIDIPGLKSDTQAAVRAALSGAAIGALGSNVTPQSVISRSTGQILNNNLELLFQGVNLRTFPYSITFSPRSEDEARIVKDIIRRLKTSMAPKAGEFDGTAGGIFIQSPDVFQLKFLKDDVDHPFLHAFKLCALTGMSVNYTNAGTYTSYEDGTPVNIRMSLTFKELNPIYHEDYMQAAAGPGVGY